MEKQELNRVFVAIGSNLGDRERNINDSIAHIYKKIGAVSKVANMIETEPIDMNSTDLFLNTAVSIETSLNPNELLTQLKEIEILMGRKSAEKNQNLSRIIDLDIIFFNDWTISTNELIIPHPRYHLRDFVLFPLSELDINLKDPLSNLTIEQLIK